MGHIRSEVARTLTGTQRHGHQAQAGDGEARMDRDACHLRVAALRCDPIGRSISDLDLMSMTERSNKMSTRGNAWAGREKKMRDSVRKYQAMFRTDDQGFSNYCQTCGELFDHEVNPCWNSDGTNRAGLSTGGECWRCAMIRMGWTLGRYQGKVYRVRSYDLMLELEDCNGDRTFAMQFDATPLGQDARCRNCGGRDATTRWHGETWTWTCTCCGEPFRTWMQLVTMAGWPEIICGHLEVEEYFDHARDDIYLVCQDCGKRLEVD